MQFIDLKAQQEQLLADGRSLREAINSRIARVLDHGQYILGPEAAELEQCLAAFVGVEHLHRDGKWHRCLIDRSYGFGCWCR